MRERIFRVVVNRVPGIRYMEARVKGWGKFRLLLLLLFLSIRYYFLFDRRLARPILAPVYEEKRLYSGGSESSLVFHESPAELARRLSAFDVISFDVFDTLLFRPFSDPADLFYLVGRKLSYPDFKRLRVEAEEEARKKKLQEAGTGEVTLPEIWEALSRRTGIPVGEGMAAEWETEKSCCFANPYMLEVVCRLQELGKRIIVVSDMYLDGKQILELLEGGGYAKPSACFVSGDQGTSKWEGGLYQRIRSRMGESLSYAHVGDNPLADERQAAKNGFHPFPYPNVSRAGAPFRAEDLSTIVGSVYRGLVNAHIHNGLTSYSRAYEYGFIYGGLFLVGYCRFIHEVADKRGIERLLFLSRDGAVLLQAYRMLYGKEAQNAVYAYWSRLAAVKITARFYREELFRRFIDHKAGGAFTLEQIFSSLELEALLPGLCMASGARPSDKLTNKNAPDVKSYLIDRWDEAMYLYEPQRLAGGRYYHQLLGGCRSGLAVDIGWAGSGAIMLDTAVNRIWGMECSITGVLAGSQARRISFSDASEAFFLDGRLESFLYSEGKNRDLWKFHDPGLLHNLYWELLLGADEGSLQGFYLDGRHEYVCRFKDKPPGAAQIREIHRGGLDFVRRFLEVENRLGIRLPVSGRDAYAPMLLALAPKNKKFLQGLEALLDDMHIG